MVGTPLSQLNLPETLDLAYVASVGGAIDVPHRLVESTDGERSLAQWTATDGIKLGTKVRVRTFTYNAQNNTYEFIRDGESTPSLIWTPIARPADSSTVSPLRPPALPADPGNTVAPVAPELETYPAIDRNDPDDYILVSPIDSGLPDTYLLFKDPRSIPGVASGYGATVDANWLKNSAKSQGAPIPSSIAEQLRGQKFNSFDGLREAIWLAASKDPELSRHFSFINNREVSKKRAPYALPEDRIGSRVKLEIHHKHWISNGGAVYDLDNLTIMTPKEHIQTHRKTRT
ncbi:S-type pyocin domain-containing protein [Pseudomonas sp. CDFA 610]|uniref:S-type pyocin domain-containing protein n=1 Tax=Pseudomonas sp. CDFA 610 TaxID=2829825 RepID=UPI002F425F15